MTPDKRRLIVERTDKNHAAHAEQRTIEWADAVERARSGWNGSPISLGRLHAELWPLISRPADLFAYIKTFKPTQPPLKDIPLLTEMLKDGGKPKK